MAAKAGKVEYTGRAFEQDASQAMGGNIDRALVELITNADDAYGTSDGEINVEVVRAGGEPTRVIVRDLAKGLAPDQLEACFGVLGAKTSGFEVGEQVRGLLGRGAKDTAAFGRAVFETIKDDTYSWFQIDRKGDTLTDQEPVTKALRKRLQIPEGRNGLVATVHIEQPGIEVHRDTRLAQRLADHVQLRRISTERTLVFQTTTDGKRSPSQQIRWTEPPSDMLVDTDLEIPGYDVPAHLVLLKLKSPADNRVGQFSKQGIEIRGAKATYHNTFFGENAPETSWIRGIVDCRHIDELIRSYDETQGTDPKNPTRLLRRDRDGLGADHPFTEALASAVLVVLTPLLEELKPPKDTTGGGKELREDLQKACKDLAKLMKADLDLIDDEPHKGGTTPTTMNPLILIPPRLKLAPASRRSLTVLIHDPAFPDGIDLSASSSHQDSVVVKSITEPVAHDIYPNTSIATVRIESQQNGDATIVVADKSTDHNASSEVTVQETVIEPDPPPETLEWRNQKMSVTVGKERSLRLRSPIDLAPSGSLSCTITLDGDACELLDKRVTLEQTDDGWLEGICRIKGLLADQSCTITAKGARKEAAGKIQVTRPGGIGGLGTEIEILDETSGSERGHIETTDTGYLIKVFGRHSGLSDLLGSKKQNGSFQHEHERYTRIAICETIASIIADWLLAREAAHYPHDFRDVDAMFVHRNQNVARYLPPLQRVIAK